MNRLRRLSQFVIVLVAVMLLLWALEVGLVPAVPLCDARRRVLTISGSCSAHQLRYGNTAVMFRI
jgi:hypothetical protein